VGAATYDSSTLASNDVHAVRHVIGDTQVNDPVAAPHFDDAEIQYELTTGGSVNEAAILLLERLAARYRQKANVSAGGQSVQLGALAQGFADQADRLRDQSVLHGGLRDLDTMRVDGYSDDLTALDVDAASYTHSDIDHPYNENKL